MQPRHTGVGVPVTAGLVGEALRWTPFLLAVQGRAICRRLRFASGRRVCFHPDPPRPWHLAWAAVVWSGARLSRDPEQADTVFYFEDRTTASSPSATGATVLNGGCRDISKSRVAAVFEAVFGYPLSVHPGRWSGPAVEKSELNGMHDGRIVDCPTVRVRGRTHQRVIDNIGADGFAYDLRTVCVGARPVVVFVKRKDVADRFGLRSRSVRLSDPDAVFSKGEIARIGAFCRAMKLHWGGLDILRDAGSGRIYVVDVNKTDMGPAVDLPFGDKLRATRRLAEAFTRLAEGARA